ncbi:MAG: hypothetical protein ACR2QO_18720 [Acidimicrobiales bacterium]
MNELLRVRHRVLVAMIGALLAGGACSSPSSNAADEIDPAGPTTDRRATGTSPVHTAVATAAGTNVELYLGAPHLAVVVDEGGSCGTPPCAEFLELGLAGDWMFTDFDGSTMSGSYDAAPLIELAGAADAEAILLGSFAGECPTVRNGTERTYLVFHPDLPETTALDAGSCRDQIDASAPLVEALDLLLAEARQ